MHAVGKQAIQLHFANFFSVAQPFAILSNIVRPSGESALARCVHETIARKVAIDFIATTNKTSPTRVPSIALGRLAYLGASIMQPNGVRGSLGVSPEGVVALLT